MFDHGDLDLIERQSLDLHLAVEAEIDRAIRSDQPFSGQRPSRQGFQHLDNDQVGRLDDKGESDHGTFVRRRIVGNRWQGMRLQIVCRDHLVDHRRGFFVCHAGQGRKSFLVRLRPCQPPAAGSGLCPGLSERPR